MNGKGQCLRANLVLSILFVCFTFLLLFNLWSPVCVYDIFLHIHTHHHHFIFISTLLKNSTHSQYSIHLSMVDKSMVVAWTHVLSKSPTFTAIKSKTIQRQMVIKTAASSYQGNFRLLLDSSISISSRLRDTQWWWWWWCHFRLLLASVWVTISFHFWDLWAHYDFTVHRLSKISHAISGTVSSHIIVIQATNHFDSVFRRGL